MPDGRLAAVVRSFHADDVMPRLLEAVRRHCVAVFSKRLDVAVRAHFHGRAAVAEVPQLVAVRGAEGADLERHRIARLDAEAGGVGGMDGRRQVLGLLLVENLYYREVVVDVAVAVGDLEDLAV